MRKKPGSDEFLTAEPRPFLRYLRKLNIYHRRSEGAVKHSCAVLENVASGACIPCFIGLHVKVKERAIFLPGRTLMS